MQWGFVPEGVPRPCRRCPARCRPRPAANSALCQLPRQRAGRAHPRSRRPGQPVLHAEARGVGSRQRRPRQLSRGRCGCWRRRASHVPAPGRHGSRGQRQAAAQRPAGCGQPIPAACGAGGSRAARRSSGAAGRSRGWAADGRSSAGCAGVRGLWQCARPVGGVRGGRGAAGMPAPRDAAPLGAAAAPAAVPAGRQPKLPRQGAGGGGAAPAGPRRGAPGRQPAGPA